MNEIGIHGLEIKINNNNKNENMSSRALVVVNTTAKQNSEMLFVDVFSRTRKTFIDMTRHAVSMVT